MHKFLMIFHYILFSFVFSIPNQTGDFQFLRIFLSQITLVNHFFCKGTVSFDSLFSFKCNRKKGTDSTNIS